MDLRTLIKFHVSLGKSMLACYKLLKGHMKLFADGTMPLRMNGKRETMTLTVEPQHRGQMNSTWNK